MNSDWLSMFLSSISWTKCENDFSDIIFLLSYHYSFAVDSAILLHLVFETKKKNLYCNSCCHLCEYIMSCIIDLGTENSRGVGQPERHHHIFKTMRVLNTFFLLIAYHNSI